MTLKEKFSIISCKDCDMPYCDIKCTILAPIDLYKLEQIADDFAIGFVEWFWVNKDKFYKGERDYYLEFNELLQIYKKEKGL